MVPRQIPRGEHHREHSGLPHAQAFQVDGRTLSSRPSEAYLHRLGTGANTGQTMNAPITLRTIWAGYRGLVREPIAKSMARFTLVTTAVAAIVSFVLPPTFRTSAAFTSSANRDIPLGALSAARNLADAFGVAGGSGATAPEFFQAVADLRSVRERVLSATFPWTEDGKVTFRSLLDIYDIRHRNPRRRIEKSTEKLGENVQVSFDRITGIVVVEAKARQPQLAAALVDTLLAVLNDANVANRQTQARVERAFLESRLAAARDSLTRAEDALVSFYKANRTFQSDPNLVAVEARHRRRIDNATLLFNQLTQEVERAAMQEVKDTPVLMVLDSAVAPAQRYWPKRKLITGFGFLVGLAVGLAFQYSQGRIKISWWEKAEESPSHS